MNFDRILILISTCSMLAVVGLSVAVQPTEPTSASSKSAVVTPAILCQEEHFEFGMLKEGDIPTHAFIVQNQTDKAFKVIDVRSTCGCLITRTELTGQQLDPGGLMHVPVAVDLQGKSGRFQGFVWVQFAYAEASDSKTVEQVIKLSVSGDVETLLVADPSTVDFGRLVPGDTKEVILSRTDGKPLQMPTLHSTSSIVSVEATELHENKCKIRLVVLGVEGSDSDPKLEAAVNVTVPGVSGLAGSLSIPVTGRLFDQVFHVSPSRFVFNAKRSKQRLIVDGEEDALRAMELTTNFESEVKLHIEPIEVNQSGRREFWLEWKSVPGLEKEGGRYVKGEVVLKSQAGSLKLPVMVGL